MPKFVNRARKSNVTNTNFPGAAILFAIRVLAIFYVLVILPMIPSEGATRWQNNVFWPVWAGLTLILVFQNWSRIDRKFFLSLPIMSLLAYIAFAVASVTWAYSPEYAFNRIVMEILFIIVIVLPYALPVSTKNTLPAAQVCYTIAFVVSAYYVLTTPPTPIGHRGYFTDKQELGLLCAIGIILSSYEILQRGWRRILGAFAICLGIWLIIESQSKSALAYSLFALGGSWVILLLCKKTRLTPGYIVFAITVALTFVSNPVQRMGFWLYGDYTLTARTYIWAFINDQIALKPWLGWGFHSYYFVPNSPMLKAPGFVAQMPSSHSGFLELKLETGMIGYWIFMVFIYSSLHMIERVRRRAPLRAWCYLSIELFEILINLTDSHWLTLDALIYFLVVAESVRYSCNPAPQPSRGPTQVAWRRSIGPPRAVCSGRFINKDDIGTGVAAGGRIG